MKFESSNLYPSFFIYLFIIIIIFFIIFQKKEKRKRKTKRGTYCLFDLHKEPSYEKAYYDNAFGLYLFKILLTQNFQRD